MRFWQLCNFIEIALLHGCSFVDLLHIFRIPYPKNTYGWLLLLYVFSQFQFSTIFSVIRANCCSHVQSLYYTVRAILCNFRDSKLYGSSLTEVFCKKGILRNFAKFTRKHLYQSLDFDKVAGLRPAILLK